MAEASIEKTQILQKYLELDQRGRIIAEYVWIDGTGNLRSKGRTLKKRITSIDQLPEWNFDGSSTNQAPGHDSDIYLKPVAYYPDLSGEVTTLLSWPHVTTMTVLQTSSTTDTKLLSYLLLIRMKKSGLV